jgi:NAD(P)-dependent dehydrogenase (short-subunit alcohol dehydrogenase family)
MASGTVLVTGASTGIGEATALHLSGLGFTVRPAVRKEEDAERLRGRGLDPLILDVTDQATIDAAATAVGDSLFGLVNNAGIAVSGPIEFVPVDELRRQLEVNLIGQVAVIQAFLPALRRARGRIVNISSIGGRTALPLAGPYAASKFALEGLSDSLRRETRGQGVEVVLVEPGGVKTPIWDKGSNEADRMLAEAPPELERLYGHLITGLRREVDRIATDTGMPASDVGEVVGRALTARRPRTRYLVGRDAKIRARVAALLPDRAFDALIARAMKS